MQRVAKINHDYQIVYISFDKSTNKIQLVTSTRLELQFKRLHLFKHRLCAYSERTNELFFYNLFSVLTTTELKRPFKLL